MTILETIGKGTYKKAICKCDCGNIKEFFIANIIPKKNARYTVSCGCKRSSIVAQKNTTHGLSKSKFYRHWRSMFNRMSEKYIDAKSYKGISICKRWQKFDNFVEDMYESFKLHEKEFGGRQTSLDRINVYKNYSPKNCRWATAREQSLNKKNTIKVIYNLEELPLKFLCIRLNKNYNSVYHRIKNGKSLEQALFSKLWSRTV